MFELAELQALAYIAQVVGVAGTLTAAFIAVRSYINANKRAEEAQAKEQETRERELETRQTQIFMDLYKIMVTKDFMLDLEAIILNWKFTGHTDFYSKYGSDIAPLEHAKFDSMLTYFDGIGLLVRRKLIDPEIVYEKLRFAVIAFWEKAKPVVVGDREKMNTPKLFAEFEYLYEQVKPLKEREDLEQKSIH